MRSLVLSGLVAIAVAGCTTAEGGQPAAAPSGSRSPTSAGQMYGAPRVAGPLDASPFLPKPCDVLTPAQMRVFGISKPGRSDTDSEIAKHVGPGCVWTADSAVNSTVGVSFTTGNKNGLADIYRGRGQFAYFEETTVDGYPAVFNDSRDFRTSGVCQITVGISDALTFRAAEDGGRKGQGACDRAKAIAAAVVATLKASA